MGLKNTITKMKNTSEGINSRFEGTEESISDNVKVSGNYPTGIAKRKRSEKNQDSLRDLWGTIKYTNIHIMGLLKREKRQKRTKNLFEKNNG